MKPKPQSVEEFLRSKKRDPKWLGGRRCLTCSHAKAEAINRELRIFAKAKKDGHEMPWSRFVRDRLIVVYGLQLAYNSIVRHARECLRIPS